MSQTETAAADRAAALRRAAYSAFAVYVLALAIALVLRYAVDGADDPMPLLIAGWIAFSLAIGLAYDAENGATDEQDTTGDAR